MPKWWFFFPENEQLKQGNYLHYFGKKKFSKSEDSDFFDFMWLYKGNNYLPVRDFLLNLLEELQYNWNIFEISVFARG